jgi:hypothetical protein
MKDILIASMSLMEAKKFKKLLEVRIYRQKMMGKASFVFICGYGTRLFWLLVTL